jgi:hypothetical protein
VNAYLNQSLLKGELQESLVRDISDYMTLKNARHHWQRYGEFYPASFQKLVNELKSEPPHKRRLK